MLETNKLNFKTLLLCLTVFFVEDAAATRDDDPNISEKPRITGQPVRSSSLLVQIDKDSGVETQKNSTPAVSEKKKNKRGRKGKKPSKNLEVTLEYVSPERWYDPSHPDLLLPGSGPLKYDSKRGILYEGKSLDQVAKDQNRIVAH